MRALVALVAILGCEATCLGGERKVVVSRGSKPFNVKQDVIVRFIVTGMTGSQVTVNLDGPAKIEAENNLVDDTDGRPNPGPMVKEFELKPTGKGKVKLDVTVTPPQPGSDSVIKHFIFTVDEPSESPKSETPKSEKLQPAPVNDSSRGPERSTDPKVIAPSKPRLTGAGRN